MKKLIYLGNTNNRYYIEEPAKQYGCEVEIGGYVSSANSMLDRVISGDYDYIVVDVKDLIISPDEFKIAIEQMKIATKARVGIMGQGLSSTMRVIQSAIEGGCDNIMLSAYPRELINECEEFIQGNSNIEIYTNSLNEKVAAEKVNKIKPLTAVNINRQTVGIAGISNRIGVTTQALQLCKYLLTKGKSVCYVEMNNSRFVDLINEFYEESIENETLGCVEYEGIEMYRKSDNVDELLTRNYEYYIYDYGYFGAEDFQKTSYYEKNKKIMVCGTSPAELEKFQEYLNELYPRQISYIFSFTTEKEKEDIDDIMDDKVNDTYIADITPDMFVLQKRTRIILKNYIRLMMSLRKHLKRRAFFQNSRKTKRKRKPIRKAKRKKGKRKWRKRSSKSMKKFKNVGIREYKQKEKERQKQEKLLKKHNLEKENVVVVEKANVIKFLIKTLINIVKVTGSIILIILATIGLVGLIYPETRNAYYEIYNSIVNQFISCITG